MGCRILAADKWTSMAYLFGVQAAAEVNCGLYFVMKCMSSYLLSGLVLVV